MCSISVAVSSRNSSGLEAIKGREAFPLRLWALKTCQEGFFPSPSLSLFLPQLPLLTCPRKLVGFHFGSFPERVRINPDPVQVGRHWIRVPAPVRLTGWDVAHPELIPVVSGTRGCAGSFPPARHLLHPPPSPLPKIQSSLWQRSCARREHRARRHRPCRCPLPCAWCPLYKFSPYKVPDGVETTRGSSSSGETCRPVLRGRTGDFAWTERACKTGP